MGDAVVGFARAKGKASVLGLAPTAVKARIGRTIGVPLTASGQRRKLGAMIFRMFGF